MSNEIQNQATGKSLAARVSPAVVYRLPDMDQVRVIPNLKYTTAPGSHLLMDVYVPPHLEAHVCRPAVLFIHGGATSDSHPKSWGIFQSWGRLIAAAGLVAVVFTHRYSPPPQSLLAEATADLRSAIDYVRANATRLQIDADRLGAIAWSSGGALLGALLEQPADYLRCLVGLCPLLDLKQYAPAGDAGALRYLTRFSAIEHLPEKGRDLPPLLIVRAGRDEIPMLNEALDRFIARGLAVNAPLFLLNHPSAEHGFDNQQDDAASRKIIRLTLEFLRAQLLGPPDS